MSKSVGLTMGTMSHPARRGRSLQGILLLALVLTTTVSSAEDRNTCVRAYDESQVLRHAKKLLAARDELLVCAQPSCPPAVVRDCSGWLREVNASLPTVVMAARDEGGYDVSEVTVLIDSKQVTERLDGYAIPVDPGPHTVVFRTKSGIEVTKEVIVLEGEKNRTISVSLPLKHSRVPEQAEPVVLGASISPPGKVKEGGPRKGAKEPTKPLPKAAGVGPGPYVVGGIGLVALGSFAYFGLRAKSEVDDMRGRCAPHCPEEDVDAAHTKAVVADVSLGIGIAAVTVAALWAVSGSSFGEFLNAASW